MMKKMNELRLDSFELDSSSQGYNRQDDEHDTCKQQFKADEDQTGSDEGQGLTKLSLHISICVARRSDCMYGLRVSVCLCVCVCVFMFVLR